MATSNCPCGQPEAYENCCQPLHLGKQIAADALTLMRSRYCAFVQQDINYLINTLQPDKRCIDDYQTLQQTCQTTRWLGLKIINAEHRGQQAEVEFVAFYEDQPVGQLHERSWFICQDDQWFYVDGQFLPAIKLQRNEPCICGSGRKFKQCHGR
ncbi:MAG: YchJ family protein [Methylophaga sp.]|nr:YchJ family protein [Methylophaga sp.]